MWALVFFACGRASSPGDHPLDTGAEAPSFVRVCATLDGVPAPGTLLMQGGGAGRATAGDDGCAEVPVDPGVVGDQVLVAAHPDARVGGVELDGPGPYVIALVRFDPRDNPLYTFADPGEGDLDATSTEACGHCHRTIHEAWSGSPHASSARNPWTQDVYAGSARALDEDACAAVGGAWRALPVPGSPGEEAPGCGVGESVRARTGSDGACADCHAPGIDGELGGRDLLEASGVAFRSGVHCDVCHHVAEVDLAAPAGVAGRLRVVRPSETGRPGIGVWAPLAFGPLPDVLNPRMGAVYREDVFHGAGLCAGCHELRQEVLVQGASADPARWPDGRLPIHTTYGEWEASGLAPTVACQSCHMAPDPAVGNAADLYNHFTDVLVGVSAGWERPPGTVRRHDWAGPRAAGSGMLALAAALDVGVERGADGGVRVAVTTTNVGPGHAIPTGEPMRQLILTVEARCEGAPLAAIGGDVVPAWGGALEERVTSTDAARAWQDARVGDVLRVVRPTGAWVDYAGFGPFGDGTFDPAGKGMPGEALVGESRVVAVDGGGLILDAPLPAWVEGDRVVRGGERADPGDDVPASPLAGAPGWAFARVLAGPDGERFVPHHEAVDVVADNRLLPGQSWTSRHTFAPCAGQVVVDATLVHRDAPWSATARGWDVRDRLMVRAQGAP